MNAGVLVKRTQQIIQDDSFTDTDILDALNKGLMQAAGRLYIPELVTTEDVTIPAGMQSAFLPDNYFDDFYFVSDSDGQPIEIALSLTALWSLTKLQEFTPIGCDNIKAVAFVGRQLYVDSVSTDDCVLRVTYKKRPEPIESLSDDILVIPEAFQEDLLVSYAAYFCFDLIEDGVGDRKENAKHYYSLFMASQAAIRDRYGLGDELPDFVPETPLG